MSEDEQEFLNLSLRAIIQFYCCARAIGTCPKAKTFTETFMENYPDVFEEHRDFLQYLDGLCAAAIRAGQKQHERIMREWKDFEKQFEKE